MSQRQCKRARKALKELEQRDRELWEFFVYLCRRTAPWRIAAYLRWRLEGKRIWEI